MKGMLFFIIGLIIVFGVFTLTKENTSLSDELSGEPSVVIGKQEIKQELEKKSVDINTDDLEKVE